MNDLSSGLDLDLRADLRDDPRTVRRHAALSFVLGIVNPGCAYVYLGSRRRAWLVVPALWGIHISSALLVVLELVPIWVFALVPLTRGLASLGVACDTAFATQNLAPSAVPRWRDYVLPGLWTWAFTLVLFPLTVLVGQPIRTNGSAMEPTLQSGDYMVVSWLVALPVVEGDIVTYNVKDGRLTYSYVSRVVQIAEEDGARWLFLEPDGEAPPDSPLLATIDETEVTGRALGIFLPSTSGWDRVDWF
ncbi:MAG: S24/S26 family peptidase [Myxococcota bacterium]